MHIRCWNQYHSDNTQISQVGYFCTSASKVTLISVWESNLWKHCDSTK